MRSTFWSGEKILVGTNAGEIFEVLATEKDKPRTIVQVCSQLSIMSELSFCSIYICYKSDQRNFRRVANAYYLPFLCTSQKQISEYSSLNFYIDE